MVLIGSTFVKARSEEIASVKQRCRENYAEPLKKAAPGANGGEEDGAEADPDAPEDAPEDTPYGRPWRHRHSRGPRSTQRYAAKATSEMQPVSFLRCLKATAFFVPALDCLIYVSADTT